MSNKWLIRSGSWTGSPINEPNLQQNFKFTPAYSSCPALAVGFNKLDISSDANYRCYVAAQDVTSTDFTAKIQTWSNTFMSNGGIAWLAVDPSISSKVQVGYWNTFQQQGTVGNSNSVQVKFQKPYDTPPAVVVWAKYGDITQEGGSYFHLQCYADTIRSDGFIAHVDSYNKPGTGSGNLFNGGLCWIAIPQAANITSGKVGGGSSGGQIAGDVTFDINFDQTPNVAIALSSIDNAGSLRTMVTTSNVTKSGFSWKINTWADTVLGVCYAQWIAWE